MFRKFEFWAGVSFLFAVQSLFQDFLGRDAYVAQVREHWISSSISVPLALVVLVVIVALDRKKGD